MSIIIKIRYAIIKFFAGKTTVVLNASIRGTLTTGNEALIVNNYFEGTK